ncbi:hypothetical protein [Blastococcus jejuensis]|uniref:hypothetical protein n=1 Tax=Blastococcus jejuensis TaxID=351224 RepID=UPI0031D24B3E
MPAPSPPASVTAEPRARTSVARALVHVVAAGLLGVVAAMTAAPPIMVSLFGGVVAVLVTVVVVIAVVAGLAVALDRAAGPGLNGRAGSVNRGVLLGVAGCVIALAIVFIAFRTGHASDLPVPLRYATAAVPFAAVAALQWPGPVRIVTTVVLVTTAAVVGIPWAQERAAAGREADIRAQIGTTARPWVTEITGLRGGAPQTTGSEWLSTPYTADGDPQPVVRLVRVPSTVAAGADPCGGQFFPPGSEYDLTSCTETAAGVWSRVADPYRQQLVTRLGGTWISAEADVDVAPALLAEALAHARPMTGDEYEAWLDAMLVHPLD